MTIPENYFHLAVKIAAATYILYKVWILLFRDRLFGLWDRIPVREKKPAAKSVKPVENRSGGAVLGRTNKILLADPRKTEPEPVATTDLEPTGFIGREEPLADDDIESPAPPYIPSDDEIDVPPPDDNGMSSGVTFDELSDAVDVLARGTTDEAMRTKAAKTLYDLQGTEVLDLIMREVCQDDAIERLRQECLDGDGLPIKKWNPLEGFDMGRYV